MTNRRPLGLDTVPEHQMTTSWTKRQCNAIDYLEDKYYLIANPVGGKHVLHCCDLGDHSKVVMAFSDWDDVIAYAERHQ